VATVRIAHDDHLPAVIVAEPFPGAHVRDGVTIRARGEDHGSGVSAISFMLGDITVATVENEDPAQPLVATTWLDLRPVADGLHPLTVAATDQAGNAASVAQLLVVDRTPPDTRVLSGPPEVTSDRTATFVIDGVDLQSPVLEFAWRLDQGVWSAFGAAMTIVLRELASGPHRFDVKARDLAGNEDPTPATQSVTVTALRKEKGIFKPSD
jgi:hypothetical protein